MESLPVAAQALLELLRDSSAPDVDWLEGVADSLVDGADPATASPAFVGAGRRLGRDPLQTDVTVNGPDDPIPTATWSRDDAARAVLLIAMSAGSPSESVACIRELYFQGDSREKRGVVRSLALLPEAQRFLPLAQDAGRTNENDLFAVLCSHNPFPARHYHEHDFNCMVMKAIFIGVELDSIIGLKERQTLDLARMALDYIDQQEAAHRRFPSNIWQLISSFAPPSAVARMLGYLNHSDASYRAGAARGLACCNDHRIRSFLVERAEIEKHPSVIEELSLALDQSP